MATESLPTRNLQRVCVDVLKASMKILTLNTIRGSGSDERGND